MRVKKSFTITLLALAALLTVFCAEFDSPPADECTVFFYYDAGNKTLIHTANGRKGSALDAKKFPEDPVRDGYTFVGWFSGFTWNAKQYTDTTVILDDVLTLYTQWAPVTVTPTCTVGENCTNDSDEPDDTTGTPTDTTKPPLNTTAYSLIINVAPSDGGNVSLNPEQPTNGYAKGTIVTATATPETGHKFVDWTGAASKSNKVTVVMDENKTLTANFEAETYVISTVAQHSNGGYPSYNNDRITFYPNTTNFNAKYNEDITVLILFDNEETLIDSIIIGNEKIPNTQWTALPSDAGISITHTVKSNNHIKVYYSEIIYKVVLKYFDNRLGVATEANNTGEPSPRYTGFISGLTSGDCYCTVNSDGHYISDVPTEITLNFQQYKSLTKNAIINNDHSVITYEIRAGSYLAPSLDSVVVSGTKLPFIGGSDDAYNFNYPSLNSEAASEITESGVVVFIGLLRDGTIFRIYVLPPAFKGTGTERVATIVVYYRSWNHNYD